MLRRTISAGVVIVLLGTALAASGQAPEPKPAAGNDPTAVQRAELAKAIYVRTLDREVQRLLAPAAGANDPKPDAPTLDGRLAERLAAWSRRWMEAERAVAAADAAARLKAVQGHVDRMRGLDDAEFLREPLKIAKEKVVKDAGFVEQFRDFSDAAHYFRLEAESWLATEKAAK
jgi:hypothetical protein